MRRSKETRIISVPARPHRARCNLCGRERLSREEYAWRRRNGYAVWRCQHRRPSPPRGGTVGDLVVVGLLTACALALVL